MNLRREHIQTISQQSSVNVRGEKSQTIVLRVTGQRQIVLPGSDSVSNNFLAVQITDDTVVSQETCSEICHRRGIGNSERSSEVSGNKPILIRCVVAVSYTHLTLP